MKKIKLYSEAELRQLQKTPGGWCLHDSEALETKFKDRNEVANRLMAKVNEDFFYKFNDHWPDDKARHVKWADENIPEKSYADRYGGPAFSCDFDYMIGPNDWVNEDELVGDYVLRKKMYFYNWSHDRYLDQPNRDPDLEYFMDYHAEFLPVLEHYARECFYTLDSKVKFYLYKLMIIEYSCPTANEENFTEHRAHCTDRFGPNHLDETLCGLHMGENIQEFEAEDPATGLWHQVPELSQDKFNLHWGEQCDQAGWIPTPHRMIHNPDPYIEGPRYVFVFDLQARYIDED
jgi:hypothetical protein